MLMPHICPLFGYYVRYYVWVGIGRYSNRSGTGQEVILREKMCRRLGISFHRRTLRFWGKSSLKIVHNLTNAIVTVIKFFFVI